MKMPKAWLVHHVTNEVFRLKALLESSAASKLGHFNKEEYIVLDDKMTLLNCVKAK